MNKQTYKPTKCTESSCAYPFKVCSVCPCNATDIKWPSSQYHDPNRVYKFARKFNIGGKISQIVMNKREPDQEKKTKLK